VPLRRGRVWKMQGTATVAGEVACTAEFLAMMADRA
jgi:3-hydroxymyristoyl/3-hydroxydecanoyl-(acyl carrier protein) dehydratase